MLRDESINVLLVEDSPSDASLIQEVFRYSRLATQIHVASDGQEAMEYLYGCGKFAGQPLPDFILLDLNLPRLDGFEVLKALKGDELLRNIPIVIVAGTLIENDIQRAARMQANLFLTKPQDSDGYLDLVKIVENFWFDYESVAQLARPLSR